MTMHKLGVTDEYCYCLKQGPLKCSQLKQLKKSVSTSRSTGYLAKKLGTKGSSCYRTKTKTNGFNARARI